MKRNLNDYEYEIVNQIHISELCFTICKTTPILQGPGNHLFPYFFNLNMSKGVLILHSLLDPTGKEISLKNYIRENKAILSSRKDFDIFLSHISKITAEFEKITPWPLRHKVIAHLDSGFKHSDFTCAYLTSDKLDNFIKISTELKDTFFTFCNYSKNDEPFMKIKEQVAFALSGVK